MRTRTLTGFTLTLLSALNASAQEAAPAPISQADTAPRQPPASTAAQQGSQLSLDASANATSASAEGELTSSSSTVEDGGVTDRPGGSASRTGFETGLRSGVGIPVGKGGRDALGAERDLGDLTSWRAPLWIDVGYRVSGATTIGLYAQVGVGGNGDACEGECDWSDLRIGVQGQWRLAPGSPVNPWLGIGVGYESLSFRTLLRIPVVDTETGDEGEASLRIAERLGGPEVLLQGGLDFVIEDALSVGPYVSASAGQYLSDGIKCQTVDFGCPEAPAIDGSGFHAWLGVGLRGSYVP